MSRLKLVIFVGLSFIFICGGIFLFPLYFYRQIPHFGQYDDTRLLKQSVSATYDHVNCQMSVYIKQSFETTQVSDAFWERLPASWRENDHEFLGYHDRALHRIRLQSLATINNKISVLRGPKQNQVFTSNTATTHFSKIACQLLPFESGYIFDNS